MHCIRIHIRTIIFKHSRPPSSSSYIPQRFSVTVISKPFWEAAEVLAWTKITSWDISYHSLTQDYTRSGLVWFQPDVEQQKNKVILSRIMVALMQDFWRVWQRRSWISTPCLILSDLCNEFGNNTASGMNWSRKCISCNNFHTMFDFKWSISTRSQSRLVWLLLICATDARLLKGLQHPEFTRVICICIIPCDTYTIYYTCMYLME